MAREKTFKAGCFKLPKTLYMYKVIRHAGGLEALHGPYKSSQKTNLLKYSAVVMENKYELNKNGDYIKV